MLRSYTLALLLVGAFSSGAAAQVTDPLVDMQVGVGGSSAGIAGLIGLGYHHHVGYFAVRSTLHIEDALLIGRTVWDVVLLYNVRYVSEQAEFVLGTGPGLIGGEGGESAFTDPSDLPTTVGLALNGQAHLFVSGRVAVGALGFANLNREESFWGLALSIKMQW